MSQLQEKFDKLVGTFEADSEYLAFIAQSENPAPKKPSAEALLDLKEPGASSVSASHKVEQESALLKFMRDRSAEKKVLPIDKRALSRALKSAIGSSTKSERIAREKQSAKESRKEKRAKEREQARGQKVLRSILTPKTILAREPKDSSFFSSTAASSISQGSGAVGALTAGGSSNEPSGRAPAAPRRNKSNKSDRISAAHMGGVTQNPEIKVQYYKD